MIRDIWIHWRENPVAMSFTKTDVSLLEIPFPSVVICPETKMLKHKLDMTSAIEKYIEQNDTSNAE